MDDLIKLEVNAETGEEIIRPYTQQEIQDHMEMIAAYEAEQESIKNTANAKISAKNKLTALGLTNDEIMAIIGE